MDFERKSMPDVIIPTKISSTGEIVVGSHNPSVIEAANDFFPVWIGEDGHDRDSIEFNLQIGRDIYVPQPTPLVF